jgi:hypothetical protein
LFCSLLVIEKEEEQIDVMALSIVCYRFNVDGVLSIVAHGAGMASF